jgi:hypothetical protein
MILNETQKQEIADYVFSITRYMETYNELFDHILSALSTDKSESFNMGLVFKIIEEDFGGIEKIKLEEEISRKALSKSFKLSLAREMLNSFKFPGIISHLAYLAFGYILYDSGTAGGKFALAFKLLSVTIIIMPMLLYGIKALILDKGRIKPAISNYALLYTSMLGMNFATTIILTFLTKNAVITLTNNTQLLIVFGSYFLLSTYFTAYLKIYKRTIKWKFQ